MKLRILTAAVAAFFMFTGFTSYAQAADNAPVNQTTISAVDTENSTKPFTPNGTSSVVDNATGEDGKEFYTIVTPNENVFYLIIDRQRETENVYFLNAVTEADLLALAEKAESSSVIPNTTTKTEVEPSPSPTPEQPPAPTPEKGGNSGMMILIIAIVLIGGGGAYYFKIYKPKQEQDDSEEEYDPNEDSEEYGDFEDTDTEDNGDYDETEPEDE